MSLYLNIGTLCVHEGRVPKRFKYSAPSPSVFRAALLSGVSFSMLSRWFSLKLLTYLK